MKGRSRSVNKLIMGLIAGVMVIGVAGSPVSAAKKPRSYVRTETVDYEAFGNVYADDDHYGMLRTAVLGETRVVTTTLTDRYMSAVITDDSGLQVGGVYTQNLDIPYTGFCGSIENAPIIGGLPVYLWAADGICGKTTTPSPATTGDIEIKLSNRSI